MRSPFRSPTHDCARAVGVTASAAAHAASAESVVSERNEQHDLKHLKFPNSESWRVVMYGSFPKDREPHRAWAADLHRTPGMHGFNAISARNQALRATECEFFSLGAALPALHPMTTIRV